ncbi:SphA family protein [Herbaspirillum seropedicae]|uniref:SphA family protein n=1 Tax=Herbaspirillum seropedicae TaxID=964 RepID=UPI0031D90922
MNDICCTGRRASAAACSALSVVCLGAFFSLPAQAVEQGATITPIGITDFGAGMLPPSSPYGTVGVRASYYSASTLKDGAGKSIPNDFHIDVKTLALAYFYMTDVEVLGARFGVGGVLPFIDISGGLKVGTPAGPLSVSGRDSGLGDMQVLPFILAWQLPPSVFVNAGLMIQAPTGAYSTSKAFNAGVNHWTYSPFVGATYITSSGLELSTQVSLNVNTVNPATRYRSGVEYRQEFAIGQHIQSWTAGLAGYVYRQLSDDSGPGSGDGNRGRVYALGPAVSFAQPGLPLVTLHGYQEFGARNRAEGYNLALRLAMTF